MKNIISLLTKEARKNRKQFIVTLKEKQTATDILNNRYLTQYATKAKLKKFKDAKTELVQYLIFRYDEKQTKALNEQLTDLYRISVSGDLIRLKISVDWKKSATWGANPTAEIWAQYSTPNKGIEGCIYQSSSISGCGYDKLSTALAEALNQIPQLKKAMYALKNKNPKVTNRELFGYGSGSSVLPRFEGGVGVSCYYDMFKATGFKFQQIANGKTYDVYTVERM